MAPSTGGFSNLVKQANQLSSEINNSRIQHRTFSGSGNRLLSNDFSRDCLQNNDDLQMSLGPNSQDRSQLDQMARPGDRRPLEKIFNTSALNDTANHKSSLTMTTTAASDFNAQTRNQSKTLDKNHKLLQDFKKKVELTQEHLLKSSSNFDMDAQMT